MGLNKGQIITFRETNYCNGSFQTIAFDSCGNAVLCPIDCKDLVKVEDDVYLSSENINANNPTNLNPPAMAKKATIQYKVPQGTAYGTPEYNEVAYSTTDGSLPTYSRGRIFTHLGTEELTICQLENWKVAPGPLGAALVNARYFA